MIDENVCAEVVYAIAPYVKNEDISDVRMRVMMTLSKYDIKKAVTDIVPYQGDINDNILKQFLIAKTVAGLHRFIWTLKTISSKQLTRSTSFKLKMTILKPEQ